MVCDVFSIFYFFFSSLFFAFLVFSSLPVAKVSFFSLFLLCPRQKGWFVCRFSAACVPSALAIACPGLLFIQRRRGRWGEGGGGVGG